MAVLTLNIYVSDILPAEKAEITPAVPQPEKKKRRRKKADTVPEFKEPAVEGEERIPVSGEYQEAKIVAKQLERAGGKKPIHLKMPRLKAMGE